MFLVITNKGFIKTKEVHKKVLFYGCLKSPKLDKFINNCMIEKTTSKQKTLTNISSIKLVIKKKSSPVNMLINLTKHPTWDN